MWLAYILDGMIVIITNNAARYFTRIFFTVFQAYWHGNFIIIDEKTKYKDAWDVSAG